MADLNSVLNLCLRRLPVQGSLDGSVGQTYLVTSSGNLIANLLNGVLIFSNLSSASRASSPTSLLLFPKKPISNIPSGLNDRTPSITTAPSCGTGTPRNPPFTSSASPTPNAVSTSANRHCGRDDTGVDTFPPGFSSRVPPVGYDFTRNQPGASEWLGYPSVAEEQFGGQSPVSCTTIQRCDP